MNARGGRRRSSGSGVRPVETELQQAAAELRVVQFTYSKPGKAAKRRKAIPLEVEWNQDGDPYLIAESLPEGEIKNFSLNRMSELQMLGKVKEVI